MRPTTIPATLALPVLLLAAPPATCDWWLWPSPHDDEVIDLDQPAADRSYGMHDGNGVGQSFVPRVSPLERIDVVFKNRYDLRRVDVRIWRWIDGDGDGRADDDEYDATVAAPALWHDSFSVPGKDDRVLQSFLPGLPVVVGAPYYVEFTTEAGDGEWALDVGTSADDPYPGGSLRLNGVFRDPPAVATPLDLTFRTYGPADEPPGPAGCVAAEGCSSATGPWIAPDLPGPPVTADEILAVVRAEADDGRATALYGDGARSADHTLLDAFLYRATGDEAYAAHVRDAFARATAHRIATRDEPLPFTWVEHPGWAYRWVRDSPALAPADHDAIRRLLLRGALGTWEKRELGVWNHALARAVGFRLVTDMIPAAEFATLSACVPGPAPACDGVFADGEQLDAADHAAWAQYAETVWTELTTEWDLLEDSSRYHYFDMMFVLELIELYDAHDEVWSAPGFRALVERLADYALPLGAYPVFGDVRGWSQAWATPVWLFEAAAARWQDPGLKWLAHRFWDYRRTHLDDERADGTPIEFHEAVYEEFPSLCHLWFVLDETIPAIQPPDPGEALDARQDAAGAFEWIADPDGLGQTFVPGASPLARIDLEARHDGDTSPGLARLWRWRGDRDATVADEPLYAGTLHVAHAPGQTVVSLFPFVAVEPGETYYFEVTRAVGLPLAGSAPFAADRYTDGRLLQAGEPRGNADLWFRVSTFEAGGSLVTTRRVSRHRLISERGTPPRLHDFGDEQVPDKLVLRGGHDPADMHAVFNLVTGPYSHGQLEAGALVSLADSGSILVADSTYEDRRLKDHNVLVTRRHRGGALVPRDDVAPLEVRTLTDTRRTTIARLGWDDPDARRVRHQRDVVFVKNRFLLVRDVARFDDAMTASTGAVWHGYDLHDERGDAWFSLFHRRPLGLNGWAFRNPERYALLHLVDRPGHEIALRNVEQEGNPASASFLVTDRVMDDMDPGDAHRFDAVLLPYGPGRTPGAVAADVRVLSSTGDTLVVKIDVGPETWTVVDNPGSSPIEAPGVTTDARLLVARTDPGGSGYVLADDATVVAVDDGAGRTIRLGWPSRTAVEIDDTASHQDTDGDHVVDAVDDDDDDDGAPDVADAEPRTPLACSDVDGDGCDDCSLGRFDPAADGADGDADGACDAGDNCVALANSGQADTDADAVGDACDNCPDDANALQLDLDRDTHGAACDNCAFVANVSQADRDGDDEGDHCDLDDGETYLVMTVDGLVEWQPEVGHDGWNVYRGDLAALRATGVYSQQPGGATSAARWCGRQATWLDDPDVPAAGAVAFYLVTGTSGGVEGGLGTDGSGAPRPNDAPCSY